MDRAKRKPDLPDQDSGFDCAWSACGKRPLRDSCVVHPEPTEPRLAPRGRITAYSHVSVHSLRERVLRAVSGLLNLGSGVHAAWVFRMTYVVLGCTALFDAPVLLAVGTLAFQEPEVLSGDIVLCLKPGCAASFISQFYLLARGLWLKVWDSYTYMYIYETTIKCTFIGPMRTTDQRCSVSNNDLWVTATYLHYPW